MGKLLINAPKVSEIHKLKHIKMMDKVHVYMCFHSALIKYTAVNQTRLFPSPFFISTGRFLILAEVFINDHIAARSTALGSANENNEMGG